jgi:hypothetical protein
LLIAATPIAPKASVIPTTSLDGPIKGVAGIMNFFPLIFSSILNK